MTKIPQSFVKTQVADEIHKGNVVSLKNDVVERFWRL